MTDLKVLISTLPVKGEESLDLQPSVTASRTSTICRQLAGQPLMTTTGMGI